jgi:hypothetical protein
MMKRIVFVIALVMIAIGLIWILQGINVLPGSFMSGNLLYTALGLVLDVVGIVLIVYAGSGIMLSSIMRIPNPRGKIPSMPRLHLAQA